MSEFVLLNAKNKMIMGRHSTLDKAVRQYDNIVSKGKRIPVYDIIQFKINARNDYFFGDIKNKWTIKPGAVWMKT